MANLVGKKFGFLTVVALNGENNTGTSWLCRCACGNDVIRFRSELERVPNSRCGKCKVGVLVGKTFGLLTVIAPHYSDVRKRVGKWVCRCKCGTKVIRSGYNLRLWKSPSCDKCKIPDLVGKQFGLLTVIASHSKKGTRSNRGRHYLCRCACGREVIRRGDGLKSRKAPFCGLCKEGKEASILNRGGTICPMGCYDRMPLPQKCQACKQRKRERSKAVASTDHARWSKLSSEAVRRGITFRLTLAEYAQLIRQECDYCVGEFGTPSKSGGLDRLDNNKSIGYVISNVVPCCTTCNSIRGDKLTPAETKVAVKAILKFRKKNKI